MFYHIWYIAHPAVVDADSSHTQTSSSTVLPTLSSQPSLRQCHSHFHPHSLDHYRSQIYAAPKPIPYCRRRVSLAHSSPISADSQMIIICPPQPFGLSCLLPRSVRPSTEELHLPITNSVLRTSSPSDLPLRSLDGVIDRGLLASQTMHSGTSGK